MMLKKILAPLDEEIAAGLEEVATLEARVAVLRDARDSLAASLEPVAPKRTARRAKPKTAARKRPKTAARKRRSSTGRRRVPTGTPAERIEGALIGDLMGRASQAALGRVSGISGTQLTRAVRELEDAGRIRATDEREGRSVVYVAKKKRVAA